MDPNKIFWYISSENSENDILDFIKEYFSLLNPSSSKKNGSRSKDILEQLLKSIVPPFTIVRETNHVDRSYSESYYIYFASKHITQSRFCERLSFFNDNVQDSDFMNEKKYKDLEKRLIGCTVIHPTPGNIIGHTILSPYRLNLKQKPFFVRLSKFNVDIRGVRFSLPGFPYRMQDMEVTTCAEVTLLNMLEYFGRRYEDYRNIQIGELVRLIEKNSMERVLPSHGLSYKIMTKVMADAGFSPRLYSGPIYEREESDILNILFYYIESGLPVGVATFQKTTNDKYESVGHSMVCIGHGRAQSNPRQYIEKRLNCQDFHYLNAADYYNEYVFMDDNEAPYNVKNFAEERTAQKAIELNIMVPLYKRMFMEATDAFTIAKGTLITSPISIDKIVNEEYSKIGTEDSPLVFRLFLASSKSYKSYKMKLSGEENQAIKTILFDLPLPRFIWICECYEKHEFKKNILGNETPLACGEIIIDATANASSPRDCVLMVHYPGYVIYRYPYQEWEVIFDEIKKFNIVNWKPFPGFTKNLSLVTK